MSGAQQNSAAYVPQPLRQLVYSSFAIAGVLLLSMLLPFVNTPGESSPKLWDGGALLIVAFLIPIIVAVALGSMCLQGRPWLALAPVGAMVALSTFALIFVVIFARFVRYYNDNLGYYEDDSRVSWGIGMVFVVLAFLASVALTIVALTKITTGSGTPLNKTFVYISAGCLLGIPLSLLTKVDGYSVFDSDSGWLEFSFVLLALAVPAVAAFGLLKLSDQGVGIAIGVLAFFASLVLAILFAGQASDEDFFSSFRVSNAAIFQLSVIASLVCAVLAVRLRPGATAAAPASIAYTPPTNIPPTNTPPPFVPPPPGTAPVWAPDPFHRHQFRYWDGSMWSSVVSDNGTVSNDLPVSAPPPPAPTPPSPTTAGVQNMLPPQAPAPRPVEQPVVRPALQIDRSPTPPNHTPPTLAPDSSSSSVPTPPNFELDEL